MTESEDAKLMAESENAKLQAQLAELLGFNVKSALFKKMVLFDRVEQERDKARADLEEYKRSCGRALEAKDAELSSERKDHQGALDRKDREREELKKDYGKRLSEKETEIAGIRTKHDAVVDAKDGVIKDLQTDRAGRDKTIEDLTKDNGELLVKLQLKRDEFKKEPETKKEIDDEVAKEKKKWEDETKPKEVSQASKAQLSGLIERASKAARGEKVEALDETERQLTAEIENEVQRRFDRRDMSDVNARAQAVVSSTIDAERAGPWQKYRDETIIPLIREMEERCRTDMAGFLRGPWQITCPSCGVLQVHIPTSVDWSFFWTIRQVWIPCTQPTCANHIVIPLITGIRVDMAKLIEERAALPQ